MWRQHRGHLERRRGCVDFLEQQFLKQLIGLLLRKLRFLRRVVVGLFLRKLRFLRRVVVGLLGRILVGLLGRIVVG
jgi:hypothetical protein